jgi:hypothetical protein
LSKFAEKLSEGGSSLKSGETHAKPKGRQGMTGIGFGTPDGDGSKEIRQQRVVSRVGLPPLSGQCGSGLQSGKVGKGGVRCAGFPAALETNNNIPNWTSLIRTGQHYFLRSQAGEIQLGKPALN